MPWGGQEIQSEGGGIQEGREGQGVVQEGQEGLRGAREGKEGQGDVAFRRDQGGDVENNNGIGVGIIRMKYDFNSSNIKKDRTFKILSNTLNICPYLIFKLLKSDVY